MGDESTYAMEQDTEMEALEAIFLEDFEKLNVGELKSIRLTLMPSIGAQNSDGVTAGAAYNDDDNDDNNEDDQSKRINSEVFVAIKMILIFPKKYPDEIPEIKIENVKGMSPSICSELQEILIEEAKKNLGMGSAFVLAEKARDFLSENNNKEAADDSDFARMARAKARKEKDGGNNPDYNHNGGYNEIEWKLIASGATGVAGKRTEDLTPCTKENFEKWLTKFLDETKPKKTKEQLELESRPTGRQLFEKNSAIFDKPAEDGGEDQGDDDLPIDEELFVNEDDDDLPSDEDDDDDFNTNSHAYHKNAYSAEEADDNGDE